MRVIAVPSDGNCVLSGSFDITALRWSLKSEAAEQISAFILWTRLPSET